MCMYTVRSYSEDTYTYLNTMTLIETCIAILFLSLLEIYHPSRIDFIESLGLESQGLAGNNAELRNFAEQIC